MSTKKSADKKRKVRVARAPQSAEQFRTFCYLFFNFIQRLDRERRKVYLDDIELATISEAIALSALEPGMRDPEFREKFGDLHKVVGLERQRGVNALSIAHATGIPRETTRRKIKKLIEIGATAEARPGEFVMKPGFMQQEVVLTGIDQVMNDLVRFINDGLDQGLFTLSPEN